MRYAIGCKLDRLISLSQLVFGVHMNAPRSGCPINHTKQALDRLEEALKNAGSLVEIDCIAYF